MDNWLILGIILEFILAVFLLLFGFILKSAANAVKELKIIVQSLVSFMDKQSEKNDNWTKQFELLWNKYNDHSKEINESKDRIKSIEYRAKYGREYRKENG
ncbi:MAG: hypothetical protein IAE98_03870 [Candidatus Kapabacteria bacterium]|nr:hypothetical protein [Candidatus Kapabacteria bacterium]